MNTAISLAAVIATSRAPPKTIADGITGGLSLPAVSLDPIRPGDERRPDLGVVSMALVDPGDAAERMP
jgi:hypothetical protein